MIQKIEVKSAFRQVGVDPAGVVNFKHVLVDLRTQFGWRGNPG